MTESFHRACKCGAIYRRTESVADGREIDSFQCDICGEILESWNTAGSHTGDSSPVRPGRPKTLKRPRDRSENGDNCPMQQLRRRVQTHGREVLGTAHRSRIL